MLVFSFYFIQHNQGHFKEKSTTPVLQIGEFILIGVGAEDTVKATVCISSISRIPYPSLAEEGALLTVLSPKPDRGNSGFEASRAHFGLLFRCLFAFCSFAENASFLNSEPHLFMVIQPPKRSR